MAPPRHMLPFSGPSFQPGIKEHILSSLVRLATEVSGGVGV